MTERPADYLPFARPSITEREKAAVLAVLDSGWLTTGRSVKRFEERFAETVGARHAVALNSATAALHLALEAMGVGAVTRSSSRPGRSPPAPRWSPTAAPEPVLVDVDAATLNATPEAILAAVTPRTKAVIVVHVAGRPIEIERLVELLEPRGIAHRRGRCPRLPESRRRPRGSVCRHVRDGRGVFVLCDEDDHDR